MRFFLDTNALIWWLADDPRLAEVRQRLITADEVLLSVVSPWELWIKATTGRLDAPADLELQLAASAITLVSPTLEDARVAAELPMIHRDPFDRMIIAQAKRRDAPILTADRVMARYDVGTILL